MAALDEELNAQDLRQLLIEHLRLENTEIQRARAVLSRVGPGYLAALVTIGTILVSMATSWAIMSYRLGSTEKIVERIAFDVGEIHDVMVAKGFISPRGRSIP